ncbi:MAG: porin family protein [Cytophagaceae bacterium]
MKNTFLTIALFASTATLSFAQDFRDKFVVGLKAGFNYSNVYDTQGESFVANPKLGLAAGAFFSIPLSKHLGIQPELLLSQKGFKGTGIYGGNSYALTRTSTYLDVPLLFVVKPTGFLSLLCGPQYSYLLNQKDVFTNGNTTMAQQQDFKNDNIRRNTLCFLGGVDINLKNFVVSGRAGWDLRRNNGDGTSTTPRYKNAWYQATIGYRFIL